MTARVARYYGWTKKEIDSLPYSDFLRFHRCIENLTAEEQLMNLNVSAYPHLKRASATKLRKSLERQATRGIQTGQRLSVKDQALKALGKLNG